MKYEFDALVKNNIQTLVFLPSACQAIGCKRVFRVKENVDDSKKV